MRGAVVASVVLAACLLSFPLVGAQDSQDDACRPPVLSFAPSPGPFEPGKSVSYFFGIENANGPPVDVVRATVTTTAPAGWSATAAQRELTLGPRNVSVDVLAITAPTRGAGAPSGNITLLVTFVCTTGAIQTSASTSSTLEVRIEEFSAPWPIVLTGFLALIVGVTLLGVRRLRRGVALTPTQPERPVEPGKSVKFTLLIENRRGKPQKLKFAPGPIPAGWSIHLALSEVDLEPGEEKSLWVILRAPATATPGEEVSVDLRLDSPRGGPRDGAVATIKARVTKEEAQP